MKCSALPMSDDNYQDTLRHADRFFEAVQETQGENLQCRRGCSLCCHGLFEIGSADVPIIADGLAQLHPMRRKAIVRRAAEIMEQTKHPDLRDCSPSEKEAFFERSSSIPCPALDEKGACLIYESRPLVCRTFGLPVRDGKRYLGDICELNFNDASQEQKEAAAWDLQWEDALGPEDEYTIPEAVLLAERLRRS